MGDRATGRRRQKLKTHWGKQAAKACSQHDQWASRGEGEVAGWHWD